MSEIGKPAGNDQNEHPISKKDREIILSMLEDIGTTTDEAIVAVHNEDEKKAGELLKETHHALRQIAWIIKSLDPTAGKGRASPLPRNERD